MSKTTMCRMAKKAIEHIRSLTDNPELLLLYITRSSRQISRSFWLQLQQQQESNANAIIRSAVRLYSRVYSHQRRALLSLFAPYYSATQLRQFGFQLSNTLHYSAFETSMEIESATTTPECQDSAMDVDDITATSESQSHPSPFDNYTRTMPPSRRAICNQTKMLLLSYLTRFSQPSSQTDNKGNEIRHLATTKKKFTGESCLKIQISSLARHPSTDSVRGTSRSRSRKLTCVRSVSRPSLFRRKSITATHHYYKCIGYSNNYEHTRFTSCVRSDKQKRSSGSVSTWAPTSASSLPTSSRTSS